MKKRTHAPFSCSKNKICVKILPRHVFERSLSWLEVLKGILTKQSASKGWKVSRDTREIWNLFNCLRHWTQFYCRKKSNRYVPSPVFVAKADLLLWFSSVWRSIYSVRGKKKNSNLRDSARVRNGKENQPPFSKPRSFVSCLEVNPPYARTNPLINQVESLRATFVKSSKITMYRTRVYRDSPFLFIHTISSRLCNDVPKVYVFLWEYAIHTNSSSYEIESDFFNNNFD